MPCRARNKFNSPRHPELVPPVWGGDPVSLVLVDNSRFLSRSSRSPLSLISDSRSAVAAAGAAADVSPPDCFFFFKRKTFSAEVLGHESIPFLSVQQREVTDPKVWIRFSVRERYSPLLRKPETRQWRHSIDQDISSTSVAALMASGFSCQKDTFSV